MINCCGMPLTLQTLCLESHYEYQHSAACMALRMGFAYFTSVTSIRQVSPCDIYVRWHVHQGLNSRSAYIIVVNACFFFKPVFITIGWAASQSTWVYSGFSSFRNFFAIATELSNPLPHVLNEKKRRNLMWLNIPKEYSAQCAPEC